jgi:hypothetical protein
MAAKKRWLVCKRRQIKREEEQSKTKKQAQKHREELIRYKTKWKIAHPEREPELPDIEEIDMSEDIVCKVEEKNGKGSGKGHGGEGPQTMTVGDLSITYDNRSGRMKVQKGEFDTISIHAGNKTCVSVDVEIVSEDNVHSVPDWNFQCDLASVESTGKFKIRVGEETREFLFATQS